MTEIPNWRTSSYTQTDTCVEVADNQETTVMVRDSKARARATLNVQPGPWSAFVEFSKGRSVRVVALAELNS